MKPILTSTLIRLAAVILAVTSLAAAASGWLALNVIDTTLTLLPGVSSTAEPSEDLLDAIELTLAEVRTTLDDVALITDRVADSTTEAAAVIDEVATLTTGQIPDSLAALEDTMPALIDTANVIDDTMSALSFLGVSYDPDQPLDDALRQVQTRLDGLPETIAAQGETIGELVDDIERIGTDTATVSGRLEAIDTGLADAEATIDDYRRAISDLGVVSDVGTDIAAAVPAARVTLILLAVSGLSLASLGWIIARRFELPVAVTPALVAGDD